MDIRKLERKAYNALKEYYEATSVVDHLEGVDCKDIGFYVSAFVTHGNDIAISGHMLTQALWLDRPEDENEIKIVDLVTAGWPAVAVGICSSNAGELYHTVHTQTKLVKQSISGVGHA